MVVCTLRLEVGSAFSVHADCDLPTWENTERTQVLVLGAEWTKMHQGYRCCVCSSTMCYMLG